MKHQFIRLFIVIFVSLLFVGWATDFFIKENEDNAHSVNIRDLQSHVKATEKNTLSLSNARIISLESLAWPKELKDKLYGGEIVSLSDIDNKVFYYWLDDTAENVTELGPFENENVNHTLYLSLSVMFYSLFALFLFFWLYPIFKDIKRLITSTNQFSTDRKKITSQVRGNSVLYPLEKSVVEMSKQIVRFLSLQRFLSSSVSHDIRTPLSRISFLLAMTDENNLAEYKVKIDREIDEIDKLTDEFIKLARLEESHSTLNIQLQPCNGWIEETISKISQSTEIEISSTIPLNYSFPHDALFLQRALQNLVVNAVKYAEHQVTLCVTDRQDYVEFCAEDDGTGIKPEEQERLTGLYERGKSSKNVGSGYGIGLAFINIITEWHGGHVQISKSSSLGGASISIFIPRSSL